MRPLYTTYFVVSRLLERNSPDFERCKFTAKELDPETEWYYFGARYLDARLGRWVSTDPPLVKGEYLPKPSDFDSEHDMYWYTLNDKTNKLPGMGGVFNPVNLNAYQYAGNNPVKFVDPDGEKMRDSLQSFGDWLHSPGPVKENLNVAGKWMHEDRARALGVCFGAAAIATVTPIAVNAAAPVITGQYFYTMVRMKLFIENFNAAKNVAVLGRFPSYLETARQLGYSKFTIGKLWDKIVKAGIDPWKFNQAFLDQIAKRGGQFVISTPDKIGGYLMREINYLKEAHGYREVIENGVMKLVK